LGGSCHPQSDGQSERTIETLIYYLRASKVEREDLALESIVNEAQKSYNNSFHSAIDCLPNYALEGKEAIESKICSKEDRLRIQERVLRKLIKTTENIKKYYDKTRRDAPDYKKGDY
jgi:hypothetical protein